MAIHNICALVGTINLIIFHIMLWRKGITTYQYIKGANNKSLSIIPMQVQNVNKQENVG